MEIEVIPNPYSAVDAKGVPQGVVGMPGMRGMWIGAMLDGAASQKTKKTRFYFPGPSTLAERGEKGVAGMRVVTLNIADANVRAMVTNALHEGSLIAVSQGSAAKLGIVKDFLPPDKALEREKQRAIDHLRAHHGDAAVLGDIPHEATPYPHEEELTEAEKKAKAAAPPAGVRVSPTVTLQPSKET